MEPDNQAGPAATVLLVDDDATNLSVFGQYLSPYYEIIVATSGQMALQLAQAVPKPDLILLDIMMPGMDGYEVIARLKANPDTQDVPVIFVTALNSNIDEERGLKLGAVDYLYKPCHLSILLARIRTQLELKQARNWLKNQNAFLEAEVERRHMENQQVHLQLLQAEKLAVIGQLAAGIAHEINNPIGFIMSNVNTLNTYLRDIFAVLDAYDALLVTPPTQDDLQKLLAIKQQKDFDYLRSDIPQLIAESRQGLLRVKNIVQGLKDFAHTGSNDWEVADVHKGLDATLTLISNEFKHRCTIHKQYGDIPEIVCLPSQLNQVFMNLLVNAAQAIMSKGDITIRTGRKDQEIWVEISDNGHGIAPEHLQRLFEPFFTTKLTGTGSTGLGLAIAENIVRQHRGRIDVTSTPGLGATFRIWLPIHPQAATQQANSRVGAR